MTYCAGLSAAKTGPPRSARLSAAFLCISAFVSSGRQYAENERHMTAIRACSLHRVQDSCSQSSTMCRSMLHAAADGSTVSPSIHGRRQPKKWTWCSSKAGWRKKLKDLLPQFFIATRKMFLVQNRAIEILILLVSVRYFLYRRRD